MQNVNLMDEPAVLTVGKTNFTRSDVRRAIIFSLPALAATVMLLAITALNWNAAQAGVDRARMDAESAMQQNDQRQVAQSIDRLRLQQERINDLTATFQETRASVLTSFAPLVALNNALPPAVRLTSARYDPVKGVVTLNGQVRSLNDLVTAQTIANGQNLPLQITGTDKSDGVLTWTGTLGNVEIANLRRYATRGPATAKGHGPRPRSRAHTGGQR